MRVPAAVLCLAIAAAGGSSVAAGCKDDDSDSSSGVDPGPTYGAEVTVRVVGRGRVTTQPNNVACPGECFSRFLFEPGSLDAMVGGVSLGAEPGIGAHFVKWTFEAIPLGIRGAGPEQCSPMTRTSTIPAINETALALTLPFGETKAVPPAGREVECAAYASTPLAYAVTATFADNDVDSGINPDAGGDILFTTPASGVEARELGIMDGRVYWRFQTLGDVRSGIASGPTSGGMPAVIVPATEIINMFDVDASVVYQFQRTTQPTLHVIRSVGGSFGPTPLQSAPVFCDAVASHATGVFCRFSNGLQIYHWPASTNHVTFLYGVQSGFDLAVDDGAVYFSEQNGAFVGAAQIRSGPRSAPVTGFPVHVVGQTTPRDLRVGATHLFWLDGVTAVGGTRSARAALKSGLNQTAGMTIQGARLIAPDPNSGPDVFWAGVYLEGEGFSIVRAAASSPDAPRIFRTGLATLGGLAVDAWYVYWTQGDGAIRQAAKPF